MVIERTVAAVEGRGWGCKRGGVRMWERVVR